jgi:hypothetical protein
MLDHRPAVHQLCLHRLQLRLQRMGVHGKPARQRHLGRRLEQVVGAPLRADGAEDGANAPVAAFVPCGEVALEHRHLLFAGAGRQGRKLGFDGGVHELVEPRQRLQKRTVGHRRGDGGAQADVTIGRGRAVECGSFPQAIDEVVLHRGDARTQALDGKQHGAQIMGPLRQRLERERRILVENPHFERQGIPKALAEALVGMGVGGDEAGDDDALGGVDHARVAARDGLLCQEIGAERCDAIAFDQYVGAVEMGPVRARHHVAVADQDGTLSRCGNRHRSTGSKRCCREPYDNRTPDACKTRSVPAVGQRMRRSAACFAPRRRRAGVILSLQACPSLSPADRSLAACGRHRPLRKTPLHRRKRRSCLCIPR